MAQAWYPGRLAKRAGVPVDNGLWAGASGDPSAPLRRTHGTVPCGDSIPRGHRTRKRITPSALIAYPADRSTGGRTRRLVHCYDYNDEA